MSWLIEQSTRNEGYWTIASLLTAFFYLYDERSWRGFAANGFHYEMQRFRTSIVPIALLSFSLPLIATMHKGFLWQFAITAVSAVIFTIYQHSVHDFSGRTLSGAAKRIFICAAVALMTIALLPMVPVTWIPLMFVTAGVAASLSSRNHLIFKLCEDTLAIRQQLASSHADRHNAELLSIKPSRFQSADDNTLKAG